MADLPVAGQSTVLWLTARRFFCDQDDCRTATFVEQIPGLTEQHARRTPGLQDALVPLALALAGRAGSRLATSMGMPVSRSTLLRLIRGLPDPPIGSVTVLGVDEFAVRRGRNYGTVLVDLSHGNRPVDVLDGRGAEDFADWLRAHPGVEFICRDRAGGYADGARDGAPQALQVADRWHLWDNLCQHVNKLVAAHHTCLIEPARLPAPREDREHWSGGPAGPATLDLPRTTRSEHTRWRFLEVRTLRVQGLSMPVIACRLELDIKTVRRYLRADSVEQLIAGGVRISKLDPFKPYLHQRLTAGARNATALHAEIANRGYTGSYNTLERYLEPLRRSDKATLTQVLRHRPPAVRQVTGWITGLPGHLDPADESRMKPIRARCPEINAAVKHVADFARMIKNLSGDQDTLTQWMVAVDHDLPALRSFTRGCRRDLEAVTAGLTLPYNSGAVEGTVNKIKVRKMQMFGRAKPDLLRKLILLS
ncbi:transposase [Nakamurella sp. UYEF19]